MPGSEGPPPCPLFCRSPLATFLHLSSPSTLFLIFSLHRRPIHGRVLLRLSRVRGPKRCGWQLHGARQWWQLLHICRQFQTTACRLAGLLLVARRVVLSLPRTLCLKSRSSAGTQ